MNCELTIVFMVWTLLLHLVGGTDLSPPCPSEIYCHGLFLHTAQMAMIYQDSKTFVDLKMKYPPNETINRFYNFMEENGAVPDRMAVELFVNETFDPAGSEFEDWIPNDWIEEPSFIKTRVKDVTFQDWILKLNNLWKLLGRKMRDEVYENQELYSIIWVPNPVIVPGGRFREFYYWDSYWIMKGLLLSEMYSTVKGMLLNFFYMVEHYGFIPNGGRIYYSQRSQPPLLPQMVQLYYEHTKDLDFLIQNIDTLEKEFKYWMESHTVSVHLHGRNYTLAVFGDKSSGPRPESYREDVMSASIFNTDAKKEEHYSELKAAAESGWDFSSRWFILNGTNKGNLTNLRTRYIVPVDLNAIIYGNAVILSEFYHILNDTIKSFHYKRLSEEWLEAVTAVLWHDDVGAWLDYDLANNIRRDYFYPTNISPLWTKCYPENRREYIVRHVVAYLDKNNIEAHQGGVPASFEHTGEQWDYPNAWPPLQHIMIMGLNATGDMVAQKAAYQLAAKWVRSNYKAFVDTGVMFEKYDATSFGGFGGGGEYEIQLGFGWTNGIIMDLLNMYGDQLTLEDDQLEGNEIPNVHEQNDIIDDYNGGSAAATTFSQVVTGLLALLVPLATGFIG